MRRIRYLIAMELLDLGAWIYPKLMCKEVSQSHHVGDKWFTWSLKK